MGFADAGPAAFSSVLDREQDRAYHYYGGAYDRMSVVDPSS